MRMYRAQGVIISHEPMHIDDEGMGEVPLAKDSFARESSSGNRGVFKTLLRRKKKDEKAKPEKGVFSMFLELEKSRQFDLLKQVWCLCWLVLRQHSASGALGF